MGLGRRFWGATGRAPWLRKGVDRAAIRGGRRRRRRADDTTAWAGANPGGRGVGQRRGGGGEWLMSGPCKARGRTWPILLDSEAKVRPYLTQSMGSLHGIQ